MMCHVIFKNVKKKIGPNIEPCGAPYIIGNEMLLFTLTDCVMVEVPNYPPTASTLLSANPHQLSFLTVLLLLW